jgi:hypothetical protein
MSGVAVDMMDRPSLKHICLHLAKKYNARISRVHMYLYRMLQEFEPGAGDDFLGFCD